MVFDMDHEPEKVRSKTYTIWALSDDAGFCCMPMLKAQASLCILSLISLALCSPESIAKPATFKIRMNTLVIIVAQQAGLNLTR